MDKTGTVTFGKPQVTDMICLNGLADTEVLKYAASLEKNSEHPIASAILSHAAAQQVAMPDPERFESLVGQGIRGVAGGKAVMLGNAKFLAEERIPLSACTGDRRCARPGGEDRAFPGAEWHCGRHRCSG